MLICNQVSQQITMVMHSEQIYLCTWVSTEITHLLVFFCSSLTENLPFIFYFLIEI